MDFPPHLKEPPDFPTFFYWYLSTYASLEGSLKYELRIQLKIEHREFLTLFGSPNSSDTIVKLKRLYKLRGHQKKYQPALEEAFRHLGVLSQLRHRLVHYNHSEQPGDIVLIGKKWDDETEHPYLDTFTFDQLKAALIDLHHVHQFFLHYTMNAEHHIPVPSIVERGREAWTPSHETWLYKQPPQALKEK
jgi:hypothetical protein